MLAFSRINGLQFTCPLCHQPVSVSLYQKITGIWEERQKVLARIRGREAILLEKIRKQKLKLQQREKKFEAEKARMILEAVAKKTYHLSSRLARLKNSEKKLKEHYRRRIDRITAAEHARVEKLARDKLNQFKRQQRGKIREQLRKARERATQDVERKYGRLQRSFHNALGQMKTKDEEIQRQRREIIELERELKRQTTPQLEGLLYEENLIKKLRKLFPKDGFEHKGKGGDIIHHVRNGKDEEAGTIIYECKRVKHYSSDHLRQALEAREKRRADFAILVTNAMKKGTNGFFTERSVLVVHATGVTSLVSVLRQQMVRISEMKLGRLERDKAVRLTLEYIEGPEFSNSMESIVQETISLYKELEDEVKKHFTQWKKRYESYAKIHHEAFTVKSTVRAVGRGEEDYKKFIEKPEYPALVELPG